MILRGWEEICAALGGISKNTARRLEAEEGLPVTTVANSPMTTKRALSEWVEKRCQVKFEVNDASFAVTGVHLRSNADSC
jgi:hypothetical protein